MVRNSEFATKAEMLDQYVELSHQVAFMKRQMMILRGQLIGVREPGTSDLGEIPTILGKK